MLEEIASVDPDNDDIDKENVSGLQGVSMSYLVLNQVVSLVSSLVSSFALPGDEKLLLFYLFDFAA